MTLSLLRTASYLLFLLAAAVVLTPVGQYIAPVLLVGLLLAHVVSIPYWVAWSRSYRHLLLDAVLIIAVTVVMYGFLFFRLGMDGASPALSLMEAMQYSLGVWVGVPFEGVVLEGAWGLRAVESVTSYFALALLVALVVLWLQEEAENGKNYMRWLKSQRLEDIEKFAGRSLSSSENGSDQAET